MFPKPRSAVISRDYASWQTNIWYIAAIQNGLRFLFASLTHGANTAS